MALNRKVFNFTVTTGAIGTTFDVTGLTGIHLSSKIACILWWSGRATAGFAEGDVRFGVGLLTGTASRRAYTFSGDHAPGANSLEAAARYNDCCIVTLDAAGALEGKCDLDSIITNGLRFIVDDQFTTALVVGGIVLWGSSLVQAGIVDWSAPASGNTDMNFGFDMTAGAIDDKFLFTVSQRSTTFGTPGNVGSFGVGVAAGHTVSEAAMCGRWSSGVSPANTSQHIRGDLGVAGLASAGLVTHRGNVSWLSNGARFTWAETALDTWVGSSLAVMGGRYSVGTILSQTGTGDTDETTAISEPSAILAFSANTAESAVDTDDDHGQMSIGAASAADERNVAFFCNQDAVAPMDIGVGFQTDAFYGRIDVTNAAKTVIGLADLVSFGASKFTFKNDDADPDQALIPYLAIGDVPVAADELMGQACM